MLHKLISDARQFGAPSKVKDERYLSKEGKMEKSFLNFKVRQHGYSGQILNLTVISGR